MEYVIAGIIEKPDGVEFFRVAYPDKQLDFENKLSEYAASWNHEVVGPNIHNWQINFKSQTDFESYNIQKLQWQSYIDRLEYNQANGIVIY